MHLEHASNPQDDKPSGYMGLGVYGLGFGVWGLEFKASGLGSYPCILEYNGKENGT